MTAPSRPSPVRPVSLSLERKLNWSGPVCCSRSQFGCCCVVRDALLGGSNCSFGLLLHFRGLVCRVNHTTGSQDEVFVPFLELRNNPSIHPLSHSVIQPVFTEHLLCTTPVEQEELWGEPGKPDSSTGLWAGLCFLWASAPLCKKRGLDERSQSPFWLWHFRVWGRFSGPRFLISRQRPSPRAQGLLGQCSGMREAQGCGVTGITHPTGDSLTYRDGLTLI